MINDELETELVLEADKDRGIHQPGIVQGMEYVDSNGNTRMKYETLHTYSSNTIKEMKAAAEKEETKVEPKVEKELVDEPEEVKEKPAPKKRATKPKATTKD